MARPSCHRVAIGFSVITCLPVSATRIVCAECRPDGDASTTQSACVSASIFSRLACPVAPVLATASASLAGSMSQTSINSQRSPCVLIALMWFAAIRPHPTKAKRILRSVTGLFMRPFPELPVRQRAASCRCGIHVLESRYRGRRHTHDAMTDPINKRAGFCVARHVYYHSELSNLKFARRGDRCQSCIIGDASKERPWHGFGSGCRASLRSARNPRWVLRARHAGTLT